MRAAAAKAGWLEVERLGLKALACSRTRECLGRRSFGESRTPPPRTAECGPTNPPKTARAPPAGAKKSKAPEPRGPGAKLGGGRSPRALSRRHTVGRLAFAGRVLPDATLRGMRMSRSHGGTVLTVSDRDLSSEASSPGSDAPCRKRLAGRGADTPANLTFASAPLPRGRLRLLAGRWPRVTGLTS